jgi:tRNA-dihydrouridine synthase B
MNIGSVEIPNPYVLAPLAGVSETAFRMLCKENGAGLLYTQMIDADVISTKTRDGAAEFLNIQEMERPIAVQLIGGEKQTLVKAVHAVEEFADIIDLNVGCIEDDYVGRCMGSALLSKPEVLEPLLSAMVSATGKPVTAKIRIGSDPQHINGVAVAQLVEDCGAQALCVHGRTASQQYAGKVNWTIMKQIKQKLSIPVIANGDVTSLRKAQNLMKNTGCDAAMIGREAMHRPWVFNPSPVDMKQQILHYIDLYERCSNRRSVVECADHVFWMLRDYPTSQEKKNVHLMGTIPRLRRFVLRLEEPARPAGSADG